MGAAFHSVPGPVVQANYVVTERAPGVPLVGSPTATIALLPATGGIAGVAAEYGERLNQFDLRVGKLFRVAGTRTMLNADFFNLFNGNAVTAWMLRDHVPWKWRMRVTALAESKGVKLTACEKQALSLTP